MAPFPSLCRKSPHWFSPTRKNTYPSPRVHQDRWKRSALPEQYSGMTAGNKPAPRPSHSIALECHCRNSHGWDSPRRRGTMVTSACEKLLQITKLKSLLRLKNPTNHLIEILACKFTSCCGTCRHCCVGWMLDAQRGEQAALQGLTVLKKTCLCAKMASNVSRR